MTAERKEQEEEVKEKRDKEIIAKVYEFDRIPSELSSCVTTIENDFQVKLDLMF